MWYNITFNSRSYHNPSGKKTAQKTRLYDRRIKVDVKWWTKTRDSRAKAIEMRSVYILHYETPLICNANASERCEGVVAFICLETMVKLIDWHVTSLNPCGNNKASVESSLIRRLECQKHWKLVQFRVNCTSLQSQNFSIQKPICNQNYPISSSLHSLQSKAIHASSSKPSIDSPLRKRKPTAFMLNSLWLWPSLKVLLLNISKSSSSSIPVA